MPKRSARTSRRILLFYDHLKISQFELDERLKREGYKFLLKVFTHFQRNLTLTQIKTNLSSETIIFYE